MDDIVKLVPPFTIVDRNGETCIRDRDAYICVTTEKLAPLIVEALVEKYAKVVTERVDP